MSYGAYFATQPSQRTYIDTSQPLNGFGATEGDSGGLLSIYDGVAGFGAAPGCGCAGTRGSLRGFGNEVLPDGTTGGGGLTVGVTQGTNIQTALIALLVVSSVAVAGYMLLGGGKTMRANGRKRRMRKNGRRKMRRNGAPKYLLTKRGKTTQRQAKAAGHYLAETRWHGGPKRVARWSGKHLAHKRFNTNPGGTWEHDTRWNSYALISGGREKGSVHLTGGAGSTTWTAWRGSKNLGKFSSAEAAKRAVVANPHASPARKPAKRKKAAAKPRRRVAAKRRAPAKRKKTTRARRRCR